VFCGHSFVKWKSRQRDLLVTKWKVLIKIIIWTLSWTMNIILNYEHYLELWTLSWTMNIILNYEHYLELWKKNAKFKFNKKIISWFLDFSTEHLFTSRGIPAFRRARVEKRWSSKSRCHIIEIYSLLNHMCVYTYSFPKPLSNLTVL